MASRPCFGCSLEYLCFRRLLRTLEGKKRHLFLHVLACEAAGAGWLWFCCLLAPRSDRPRQPQVTHLLRLLQWHLACPFNDPAALGAAHNLAPARGCLLLS